MHDTPVPSYLDSCPVASGSTATTRWRGVRHDVASLSGGALLGLGIACGPYSVVLAWIVVTGGIALSLIGIVWPVTQRGSGQFDYGPWEDAFDFAWAFDCSH